MTEAELNEKYNIHNIIQESIAKAHPNPSPETLSRLDSIDKKMEDNYSKRELDDHFRNVNDSIGKVAMDVKELVIKVGIQNGSVGNLKAWRTGTTMAIAVIAFLVIPLVIYSFKLSLDNVKISILSEIKNTK